MASTTARKHESQTIQAIRSTFVYGTDVTGKVIGTLPSGAMVTGVRLRVDTGFDGTGVTLSLGYAGAVSALMTTTTAAPGTAGSKAGILFPALAADQDIIVTFAAGTTPTVGSAEVIVEFYPHAS